MTMIHSSRGLRRESKITLFWLFAGFVLLLCGIGSVFFFINIDFSSIPDGVQRTAPATSSIKPTGPSAFTSDAPSTVNPQCSGVPDLRKWDCHPDVPVLQEDCLSRGCCYDASKQNDRGIPGIPQCYYPSGYVGYKITYEDNAEDGLNAKLQRVTPSGFPEDIQNLTFKVSYIDNNALRIKITDSSTKRYEAPLYNEVSYEKTGQKRLYDVDLSPDGMLSLMRRSSGVKVFTTNLSYLVYSNQFLQLSAELSSRYIYGLGEHYTPLLKDFNWTRLTFFNKDNFPGPGLNIYGSHPFYLLLENSEESHGVLLLNSNSMDVVLQPNPAITYRTIGGIFDFFVFFGPSPTAVIQQYTELVGRPFLPPYWSFGFHLCKYGYNSLEETRKVHLRTKKAGVPYDVQWNDIDYMDRHNDFTYDKVNFKDLPQFVKELHDDNMRYIPMFDPGVSNTELPGTYPPYDEGVVENVFVKNNTGDIFIGKVWNPISTVFPDFTHPNATSYWTRQFRYFHDIVPFDGAWIDMNEISNFYYNGTVNGCPQNSAIEDPPYLPGNRVPLRTQTLCMTAKHYNTIHYNEHNVYGLREGVATNIAMQNVTGKRAFVISRATFPGQGRFTGHWSGDIASTWEDMRYSIINMINFNLYGVPMVGSDICGFRLSTTKELCARWFALGAFYPFARNHNDIERVEQDPAALGGEVLSSAKNNLLTRYSLLPYLYYLFYRSHVFGEPVVRPLFFEFTNDPITYTVDEQFLWGPSLLIIPALYQGITDVVAYFPQATWYDFYTGEKRVSTGNKYILPTPIDRINLAIRASSILVLQHPNTTTAQSRLNDFMLYVALGDDKDAFGELYWDDGESIGSYENQEYNLIQFHYHNGTLKSEIVHSGYNTTMKLDTIKIFGLDTVPDAVSVNHDNSTFRWEDKYNTLVVEANSISLLESLIIVLQ